MLIFLSTIICAALIATPRIIRAVKEKKQRDCEKKGGDKRASD